ncbi:MAG: SLBB domain-containing protein, partial [Alphaproteobacteria bacterium]|nr:SLBB domain-containing protein [Alphaproteobacteria bacterium]
ADRLAGGYLVNPQVIANVDKYRPFFVIGGVRDPGAYEYQANMTISKAVALAGGRTLLSIEGAAPRILRANGELVGGENISVDTTVFPGDFVEILWVPPWTDPEHSKAQ